MNFAPITKEEWESNGQALKEGRGTATIKDVFEGNTAQGVPKLIIEWHVEQENSNGTLQDHISAQARWKIVNVCKALCNNELTKKVVSNGEMTRGDLIGKKCSVELQKNSYNGKTFLQISRYYPENIGNKAPIDAMPTRDVEQPVPDDDIPF